MDAWAQLLWERSPETDDHRDRARRPYEQRELRQIEAALYRRKLSITEFISKYAYGDNLATSGELLARSRQLIGDSKAQILRCRMRLLMCHGGKAVQ